MLTLIVPTISEINVSGSSCVDGLSGYKPIVRFYGNYLGTRKQNGIEFYVKILLYSGYIFLLNVKILCSNTVMSASSITFKKRAEQNTDPALYGSSNASISP